MKRATPFASRDAKSCLLAERCWRTTRSLVLCFSLAALLLHPARLHAQAASWLDGDIGSVAAAGSTTGSDPNFTISGSGADIWDRQDAFHFHYQNWTGDGDVIAKIGSLTNTDSWAKAGVMFRNGLDPAAANVLVAVTPDGVTEVQYRGSAGDVTAMGATSWSGSQWVKLSRRGNVFTAYYSSSGASWTQLGSALTLNLSATLQVGLAVTSHNDGVLCTANFSPGVPPGTPAPSTPAAPSNVSATLLDHSSGQVHVSWVNNATNATHFEIARITTSGTVPPPEDPTTFQAIGTAPATATSYDDHVFANALYYVVRAVVDPVVPSDPKVYSPYSNIAVLSSTTNWLSQEMGQTGAAGGATTTDSLTYTVSGAGADIGGTVDAGHFHSLFTGSYLLARITSLDNTDPAAKAGIAVRASNTSQAANAFVYVTPAGNIAFQYRRVEAANTVVTTTAGITLPVWLKLSLDGNVCTGYYSSDGNTWTSLGTATPILGSNPQVGFAVTSHRFGTLCHATFDRLKAGPITTFSPPQWPTPATPQGVTATAVSPTEIDLTWDNAVDDVMGYDIQWSTDGVNFTHAGGANNPFWKWAGLTGVTTATRYSFRVRSYNPDGYSAFSNVSTAAGSDAANAPAAPSGLSATAARTGNRVDLAWTDNSGNETGFEIERATLQTPFVRIGTVAANTTTFSDTSGSYSTLYYYRVRAINGASPSPYCSTAWANTGPDPSLPPLPAAPGNVTATAPSPTQVNLSWTESSANATSYVIIRAASTGNYLDNVIAQIPATSTQYSDTTVKAGNSYTYYIRAANDGGASGYSSAAGVTTPSSVSTGSGWQSGDIGSVAAQGSTGINNNGATLTVAGSGADIWGTTDACQFAYQTLNGDGTITARVSSMTNTTSWAKAGVMIRESLDPSARNVFVALTPQIHGVVAQYRTNPGDDTGQVAGPVVYPPYWVRLARNGNVFTAYSSADGTNWTTLTTINWITMAANTYVGLAVTSHADGVICNATFDYVSITSGPPSATPTAAIGTIMPGSLTSSGAVTSSGSFSLSGTAPAGSVVEVWLQSASNSSPAPGLLGTATASASGLWSFAASSFGTGTYDLQARIQSSSGTPNPFSSTFTVTVQSTDATATWLSQDIGDTNPAGSTSGIGPVTLQGAGADIGGGADAGRFYYRGFSGDFTLIGRVTGLTNTNANAKAAAMIRYSLAPGSAMLATFVTPTSGVGSVSRSTTDTYAQGMTLSSTASSTTWLRVERHGNYLSTSYSSDGMSWNGGSGMSASLAPNAMVIAGFAVTSHANGVLCTATFDQISSYTPPLAPTNPNAQALSSTQIQVSWTDNSNNETAFQIDRSTDGTNFSSAYSAGANVTSFTDSGLNPGTGYYYRIRAVNSYQWSPYTATVSATTPPSSTVPPTSPSGLTATLSAPQQVLLQWNDNSGNETGFVVQRSTDGQNFSPIFTTDANVVTYTDATVIPATKYYYYVRAFNSVGSSAGTNIASVTTEAASGWTMKNVGTVGAAGSATPQGSALYVSGSGSDIWGTSDSFGFAYQALSGDGALTARVISIDNTDPWAKAGLMIRESLDANARNVFACITPTSHGIVAQSRSTPGDGTAQTAGPAANAPFWLRVARQGSSFTAASSADGVTWTTFATYSVTMASNAFIGFAVTSHSDGVLCTAGFDSIALTGSATTANPPVVTNANVSGQVGIAISPVTVSATNGPNTFSAPGLSYYGLAIAASTGVITGTPTMPVYGSSVIVTATNNVGSSSGYITLNISSSSTPPTVISSISPGTASSGGATTTSSSFTLTGTANPGSAIDVWLKSTSNTSSPLPGRMTTVNADASGAWSATVSGFMPGTAVFNANVQNGSGTNYPASNDFTVTIQSPAGSGTWLSNGFAAPGRTSFVGTTISVASQSADIWGTSDAFQYFSGFLTGDGSITARVVSMDNTNEWAKAGVMFREQLSASARNVFAAITPAWNGIVAQARSTAGDVTTNAMGPNLNPAYWLRLTRSGNTFTASSSPDGTTWAAYATFTVAMNSGAYVGLAVTSHNASAMGTAVFDHVTVTAGPSSSGAPVVTNATVSGQVGTAISPVTISATNGPNTFSAPGLASYGLAISSSGVISGTPSTTASGAQVTVTATNSAGSGTGVVTLNLAASSSTVSTVITGITPGTPTSGGATANGSNFTLTGTAAANIKVDLALESSTSSALPGFWTSATANSGGAWSVPMSLMPGIYRFVAYADPNGPSAPAFTITVPNPAGSGTWNSTNVGGTGTVEFTATTITLSSKSADIWGTSDEFQFFYAFLNGDGSITARVASMDNTSEWAKAGVMFRDGTLPDARYAFAAITPSWNGIVAQARTTSGGTTVNTTGPNLNPPYWLRLTRSGNTFTASSSPDGNVWAAYATYTVTLLTNAYVGLAVTSHNSGATCTAVFDHLTITSGSSTSGVPVVTNATVTGQVGTAISPVTVSATNSPTAFSAPGLASYGLAISNSGVISGTPTAAASGAQVTVTATNSAGSGNGIITLNLTAAGPPPPPPSSWSSADIGSVGMSGSNSASGNTITVAGSGADVWGTADGFRFVWKPWSGDGVVEAQVSSMGATNGWAKAGVMIRESAAAGARNVFVALTPDWHGIVAQARSNPDDVTAQTQGPAKNAPYWVRLARAGNTFTASTSVDGMTWTTFATYNVTMSTTAYFGFAVTAHDTAQLNTAVFTDPYVGTP